MKTKFIMMAAFAAMFSASFVACTNEESQGVPQTENKSIAFIDNTRSGVATRALEANTADIQADGMLVWGCSADATHEANAFMFGTANTGVDFAWNATEGSFISNPEYLWSSVQNLSFIAMTPRSGGGIDGTSFNAAVAANSPNPSLSVDVSIPTTLATQKDIMFAAANSKNYDDDVAGLTAPATGKPKALPLTFKHALSQIKFKGKLEYGTSITKVTVKEISLVNVACAGTLNITSSSDVTTCTVSGYGATNNTLTANIVNADVTDTYKTAAGTTYLDITNGDAGNNAATRTQQIYMLPQIVNTGVSAQQSSYDIPASGAYLRVKIDMWLNGTADANKVLTDKFVYIKLNETTWLPNFTYIYNLEFSDNLMNPIRFTTSIDYWLAENRPYTL